MRKTVFFYCQHSVGMGHLVRSAALAERLADVFDVVFLNGGAVPEGLHFPSSVRRVDLPPIGMREDNSIFSIDPALTAAEALELRRDRMLALLRTLRPAVLLVELFPFGRKKFEPELLPLLAAARALGDDRPLTVCSLRDLLVTARRSQQEFDDQARARCDAYFDLVLVHTDPAFVRLDESFRPTVPLTTPVEYTGFLTRDASGDGPARVREGLVVSAGGGQVGESLYRAAVAAHDLNWPRLGLATTVVAGPFAPAHVLRDLQDAASSRPGLTILPHVPALGPLLMGARVSVSQCGYNTALDLLRTGVPSLVVPYAEGRENEQTRRAERLAARGLLRTVAASDLTGERLADEVRTLLDFTPSAAGLRLDGAAVTLDLLVTCASGGFAPATALVETPR
jgi:predicted glycosyltransferase